jgi:glucose-1-phosphate cytidylyltransferase
MEVFSSYSHRQSTEIKDDATPWEGEPLEGLARDNQLQAFRHNGFWHAVDTLRDKRILEQLWVAGRPP